ncbi:MAG: AbrB/MazE/SpoVT family DNA-binding domain-containing protein [Chloroflexi bacterium HGW-Chloroflexi-2]|jgi:AbrB family looped-hinge helix DNA binding protein|nr:MAG: AbrB/MazE/SpoVT family DNA-binding domain-containing protein [Chloroflexi bacterium HGW-Chloroflexi-2]
MELAKITSKGQITLPISIRRALKLKDGDKVAFIERNGQYILINPVLLAIREVQEAYDGEAEKLGLKDIDDVVDMVKEIREVRKKD